MNERHKVNEIHRNNRLASEATGSAETLQKIERAALAYRDKIAGKREELSQTYNEETVEKMLNEERLDWHEYKTSLEDEIAVVEASIGEDDAPDLPARTDDHREESARFRQLRGDARERALEDALFGKNDVLAVALLTDGAPQITEPTYNSLAKRFANQNHTAKNSRRQTLRDLATGTRLTLDEINEAIKGA
jgi:hypothetical protein